MKTFIIFTFAVVTVVKALVQPPPVVPPGIPPIPLPVTPVKAPGGELIQPDPKCLISQCGPPMGVFTIYCNSICATSGFQKGECSNVNGQHAQCLCTGGKGDATLLLNESCDVLCGRACNTCGYNGGTCSTPIDPKSHIQCECTEKEKEASEPSEPSEPTEP